MECLGSEENNGLNNLNTKCTGSTENFQKFIYELFEKHGILNDLRAYLRGHILNVLKTAETGDLTSCQKNFTQRLEFKYQAINILIAEYLLRQEFNYTLSVFVSEIPLANMIFDFNKALLKNMEPSDLNFGDNDVWSILSCLGIKCDSEHACKIVEMYNSEMVPLLLCIFKCTPLWSKESIIIDNALTSDDKLSGRSADSIQESCERQDKATRKCRHYSYCTTCQYRVLRIKDRYERRLNQNPKEASENSLDVASLMKNLSVIEQSIINEMFEQLKSVYDSEVDMIKEEQEATIEKSIASHTRRLQKQRDELEASFKERESELFKTIEEKKKFLWNLAKSLRQQHDAMTKAMDDVRSETERLNAKELNLKAELQEAEDLLRKRGDVMRKEISEELRTLEQHLHSMKKERDIINVEREKLEMLKERYSKDVKSERKEYDSLKNEVQVLKHYVEAANLKCSAERATDGAINIINDLKQKNINFVANEYRDLQRASASLSSDRESNELQRLRSENQRLDALARQQSDHIASLASGRSAVCSEATRARPQTAPTSLQPFARSINTNNALVSSIGGGEQMNLFPRRPRTFIPSDALPFMGALKHRHVDNRRHLTSQWRALRRRATPQVAASSKPVLRDGVDRREEPGQSSDFAMSSDRDDAPSCSCNVCIQQTKKQGVSELNNERSKPREKSPKPVLREAKEKLRNNRSTNEAPPIRERSPVTTLREAKMRLRKLEIEAEAVERSYQAFRRKQRDEADAGSLGAASDIRKNNSRPKPDENKVNYKANLDFDAHLKQYPTFHTFKNKNAMSAMIKPIPLGLSDVEQKNCNRSSVNYLETPLKEFRKLYKTKNKSKTIRSMNIVDEEREKPVGETVEVEMLKDNINKIYDFTPNSAKSDRAVTLLNAPEEKATENADGTEENLLRVGIENCESNSIKIDTDKVVLVVESSITPKEISECEIDEKDGIGTRMTILISPKVEGESRSSDVEKITEEDVLNAIFHSEKEHLSSVDMQLELSKRDSIDGGDDHDEYPDDFSADVDNYNSSSDCGRSPISLAKDSDNFWET